MFISFEGVDGCGKTTQIKMLFEHLKAEGHNVIKTREPGGSPGAEEIRTLILTGDVDRWSAETEILLFNAARRDHVERTIKPALAAGKVVLSDRFADSTRAFQGATRGDLRPLVDKLHGLAVGMEPDLTLILDIDPKVGLSRSLGRSGNHEVRFEEFGLDFQQKVHAYLKQLATDFPKRCVLIDALGSPEEVFARVWEAVAVRLL